MTSSKETFFPPLRLIDWAIGTLRGTVILTRTGLSFRSGWTLKKTIPFLSSGKSPSSASSSTRNVRGYRRFSSWTKEWTSSDQRGMPFTVLSFNGVGVRVAKRECRVLSASNAQRRLTFKCSRNQTSSTCSTLRTTTILFGCKKWDSHGEYVRLPRSMSSCSSRMMNSTRNL